MAIQQEQLPDRARSLCDVERDVPAVDDERRARMLARIERATRSNGASSSSTRKVAAAALVVPALSETTTGAAATSGSTGFALLVKSKIVIGLLAFGAGAGTGASIHAIVATPVAAPAGAPSASVSAVAARPSTPPPRAPIVDAQPSAAPPPSAAPSASPVVVSPAQPPPSSSTNAASARRERALIDQARIAVLRGDKASALAALRTHAVEFPDGQHREERETLMRRAEALP